MNNIDSVDEERQMRKDVKKLILEKQLMNKVMTANTYYINIDSTQTGVQTNFKDIKFFLNGIGKDHIQNARLSVVSFALRGLGSDGFGTQQTSQRNFQLSISCLRNNSFFFDKRPTGASVSSTMINTNFYPMITCENYGTSSTGKVVQMFMNREGPAMSCENPFGKELRIMLFKADGKTLATSTTGTAGGALAGEDGYAMCLKIELLPDFNENDRINY